MGSGIWFQPRRKVYPVPFGFALMAFSAESLKVGVVVGAPSKDGTPVVNLKSLEHVVRGRTPVTPLFDIVAPNFDALTAVPSPSADVLFHLMTQITHREQPTWLDWYWFAKTLLCLVMIVFRSSEQNGKQIVQIATDIFGQSIVNQGIAEPGSGMSQFVFRLFLGFLFLSNLLVVQTLTVLHAHEWPHLAGNGNLDSRHHHYCQLGCQQNDFARVHSVSTVYGLFSEQPIGKTRGKQAMTHLPIRR